MPSRRFTSGRKFSTTTSALRTMRLKAASASGCLRLSVMLRLLRWRFWKSGPSRGPPSGSAPPGSVGSSILMTLAPQSASSRTQVGPARTRVRSRTVNRSSAREPRGNAMISAPRVALALRRKTAYSARHSPILHWLSTGCRLRASGNIGMVRAGPGGAQNRQHARTPAIILPYLTMTRLLSLRSLAARLLLALLVAGATAVAVAQEAPHRREAPQSEQQHPEQRRGDAHENLLRLLPADAVTEHTVDIAAGKLAYTATAGTLSLLDQTGERSAAIYYTSYVAKGNGATTRPITFAFNGGPGAASAYLTLGLVGPRVADLGSDAAAPQLKDNPQTWLAFTDLVMIDPIGTGWSRPAKADGGKAFFGVRADA